MDPHNATPNGYSLGPTLGSGGFGRVYPVHNKMDECSLVLKMPREELGEEDLWRFSREVRLQSQLTHPNIVEILDYDLDARPPWYVMERADRNFADALPTIDILTALGMFKQALDAIAYAHRNKVIHRDLKPANFLIFDGPSGLRPVLKVSDFGLGRPIVRETSEETETAFFAGTPGYYPPEQYHNFRQADERADVYALGKILKVILERIPCENHEPRTFDYCIKRATAENPVERYANAAEMHDDFLLLLERPTALDRPEGRAVQVLQDVVQCGNLDADRTLPLARFLFEHRQNQRLLMRILPRIPEDLLHALIQKHPNLLFDVFASYDIYLSRPVTKDYAENAVRLLEAVFMAASHHSLRSLCLRRILSLAVDYDIYEAGYSLATMVSVSDDPRVVTDFARHLRTNPHEVEWCSPYMRSVDLPNLLADIIRPQ